MVPLFRGFVALHLIFHHAGEFIGLRVYHNDFEANQWLGCTTEGCEINTCPGKKLKKNDMERCPPNIMAMYKLDMGRLSNSVAPNSSAVVRVGDPVVLYHPFVTEERQQYFVSCDPETLTCALSTKCGTKRYNYTSAFCRENILIVKAEGKRVGEAVTHRDVIGFEFMTHPSFQDCFFDCDANTNVCSKVTCSSNEPSSPTQNTSQASCGKKLFLVQKL